MMKETQGLGMRRSSIFMLVGGASLLLAVSVGFFIWFKYAALMSANLQPEQVVLAVNTEYVGSCSVIVAQDEGFFINEGLQVLIKPYTSGKAAMAAIAQKNADLGTVADIPVMFAGLDGSPISVIATIFSGEKDHGIVGRKDRDIKEPNNLKGKSVGVPLGTSAHFTLDAFLNRQKLLSNEVAVHNYKPEELPIALAEGKVDAVAIWEPFLGSALEKLGNNGVVFYGQDVYESIYNMVGTQGYISQHPKTVKKILSALIQAAKICNNNPESAQKIVSRVTKIELERLKADWSTYQFDIVLDQGLILALEDEARWAIKKKLTDKLKVPNYLNSMYIDGLESVNPSAVTIIH